MKNPNRSLRRTVARAKVGVAAVARRLRTLVAVFGEASRSVRERYTTVASELVAMMAHHLIMAVIERAAAWLFRKFACRPTGAQVLPFPALRPVP